MSWGATAFTPMITYNQPPFGFAEKQTVPDFPTCNVNPWSTAERVRRDIQDGLKVQEDRRRLNTQDGDDYANGFNDEYDIAKQLRCDGQVDYAGNGAIDKHYNESMIEKFTGAMSGIDINTILLIALFTILVLYVQKRL